MNRAKERKQRYVDKLRPFPVQLAASKEKGRFLIAAEDLQPGQIILTEFPIAAVLFQQHISKYCAKCFISKPDLIKCSCSQAFWCSSCDPGNHAKVCNLFRHVSGIAGASGLDDSMVRLIANCLVCEYQSEMDVASVQYPSMADADQVNSMIFHRQNASPELLESSKLAAIDIIEYLNLQHTTAEYIIKLALQINANSFALHNQRGDSTIGVGIYPLSALANHSCKPNVHFTTSKYGVQSFRTIDYIPKGAEILDTYTDIFVSVRDRQDTLLNTKHFICTCSRCSDDNPASSMDGLKNPTQDPEIITKYFERKLDSVSDFLKMGDNSTSLDLLLALEIESDKLLDQFHATRLLILNQLMNTSYF
jgi:hypothetical protein